YLAGASHLRRLDGLLDFTGEPLTVFGPVFPLLLAPGGRSLLWASIIGALSVAGGTALMWANLRHRVRWGSALLGAAAFGAAQGLVRVASTVWSEAPYIAISLATLLVLGRPLAGLITERRAAIGGALAGVGFLTRYAGAGLVMTALTMVAVAAIGGGRRHVVRCVGAAAASAVAIAAIWVVRNLVETGEALGPRFEGGTSEPVRTLVQRPFAPIGQLVVGFHMSADTTERVGQLVAVALAAITVWMFAGRSRRVIDIGMALFAITSIVVPVLARAATSNDIEYRVMSPILVPIIWFAVVGCDAIAHRRAVIVAGAALTAWWCWQGVAMAADVPDFLSGSAGTAQFSPALYDAIDELPSDAIVLTNNPQRVWFQTGREPTLFAFTRPRAGNSHYPISAAATLSRACAGNAYLAWFPGLANTLGLEPEQLRPDLVAVVRLDEVSAVAGGTLYQLSPIDPSDCTS
ncbi:unnamed protein product, partial [Phaeothamnion confervicola]